MGSAPRAAARKRADDDPRDREGCAFTGVSASAGESDTSPDRVWGLTTAFVDRDGTINVSPPQGEYVTRPEQLRLLPGAADGVRALSQAGLRVVVVTNQRGIALGQMTVSDLNAIHRKMLADLSAGDARVDAIYHCPHGDGECDCRKPLTGMFERARDELGGIDFARSVVIGDSPRDWQAGRTLGCRVVAIGDPGAEPVDRAEPSLAAAATWLTRGALTETRQ